MRAWWHWVLAILGTIVAVALLAAGALTYLVLRLDVRGEVERAVESATGRNLTISGDVGVSFWPVLGLHAANDTLANVAGGARRPSLSPTIFMSAWNCRPCSIGKWSCASLCFKIPALRSRLMRAVIPIGRSRRRRGRRRRLPIPRPLA